MEIQNLRLPLTKISVGYFEKAYLGLHFIRCLVLQAQEDLLSTGPKTIDGLPFVWPESDHKCRKRSR